MTKQSAARAPAVRVERVEPPLYRVIRLTSIHGLSLKIGERTGGRNCWPNLGALEPANLTARKIADYMNRFGHSRCFPSRPYDHFFGCYYLPAALPSGHPTYGAALTAHDSHPRYEEPAGCPLYVSSHDVCFEDVVIPAGRMFAWLRWPLAGWRAASDSASQTVRYMTQHGGEHPHPDLKHVISPWCELRGLFLPELRPLNEKPARTSPPIITSHGVLEENGGIA